MAEIHLAETIKYFRKKAGLTQAEVATALGIKRSTYAYYESGKTKPKLPAMKDIANMYKITLDELVDGEKPNEEDEKLPNVAYSSDFDDKFFDLTDVEKTVVLRLRVMNRTKRKEILDQIIG